MDEKTEALELYNKLKKYCINTFGEENSKMASINNKIAIIYIKQGKGNEALELFNKSLKIYHNIFDEKHQKIALIYRNIGSVYVR